MHMNVALVAHAASPVEERPESVFWILIISLETGCSSVCPAFGHIINIQHCSESMADES